MSDQFVGQVLAFKGELEFCPKQEILFDMTDVTGDSVEVAFNLGKERIYISLPLSEVVARAIAFHQD